MINFVGAALSSKADNSIKEKLTKKTLLAFLANFLFGCLYVDFRSGNMAVYQSGLRASLDKTYHEQFWPVPEQYENCSKIAMLLLYRHSAVIKQFIDDPFLNPFTSVKDVFFFYRKSTGLSRLNILICTEFNFVVFFLLSSRSTVYNVGTLGTRLGSTLMSRGGVGGGGGGVGGVSPARSPNGDFKNFDTTR